MLRDCFFGGFNLLVRIIYDLKICVHVKGYSTVLRTLTSGNATFSLELDTYEAMNPQEQNTLLKRLSGLL